MKNRVLELQCQFRVGGKWQAVLEWADSEENRAEAEALLRARHELNRMAYRIDVVTRETIFETSRGERGDSH